MRKWSPFGRWLAIASLLAAVIFTDPLLGAEILRLPATKDNSIVLVDGEWEENAGQQGRLRIKGNQHLVAMDFDTSAIRGKRVTKATLVCELADQEIQAVSVSTIAAAWDENRSNGLTAGMDGIRGWGFEGAKFPAVCGGNGFTLVDQAPSEIRGGAYHWELSPDLVHALAIGAAYGLAIHEHEADYGRNPTIFAREQAGKKPYLLVKVESASQPPPAPPSNLRVNFSDEGTAWLNLTAPDAGLAYEVTVGGQPLARHNTPPVGPGSEQWLPLRDLPASISLEQPLEIEVSTIDRLGQRSEPARLTASIASITNPTRTSVSIPAAKAPAITGVSVIPVTDKYDVTGKPVGSLPDDYRTHNVLFDGQRIRLIGAAGEVVGFQTLIRGTGRATISVQLESPLDNARIDLFQAIYVPAENRRIPDPLLPLKRPIELSKDQDQVIVADVFIPFDATAGGRVGELRIGNDRVVPIELFVLPYKLPQQASFLCEMNGYGLPDQVSEYYAQQQVAYDHRVHCNILHYSHNTAAPGSRKSNLDMRLPSGRRMDNKRYNDIQPGAKTAYWDDFVQAFGPYVDGSLFKDGHRGPIPAPGFYLTFHESWPLHCREFFNGNPDAFEAFKNSPLYAETYVNVLADFAKLAKQKNWTETGFQVYFNNKGAMDALTKAPWILDEPSGFWDYRALGYYGELTDRGRADADDLTIDYRVDISRPEFTRGQLDHRADLWIVSTSAFQNYRRLVSDRIERDGLRAWVYGTTNHVHDSNRNTQAWALDAWQYGANGVVPWQTVNKDGSALQQADQLGLFIFDKDETGETVIRHSIRLKAYREAEQLIEHLALLKRRKGWNQPQMRAFIAQHTSLGAQVDKTSEEDAGTTAYGAATAISLELLRLAVVKELTGSASIVN